MGLLDGSSWMSQKPRWIRSGRCGGCGAHDGPVKVIAGRVQRCEKCLGKSAPGFEEPVRKLPAERMTAIGSVAVQYRRPEKPKVKPVVKRAYRGEAENRQPDMLGHLPRKDGPAKKPDVLSSEWWNA